MRALLPILAVLFLARPAVAQPDQKLRARAKEHFEKGRSLQKDAHYAEALVEYRTAYELVKTPDLLYNIALVLRLKGDKQEALDHYRRYLELAPNGRGSTEAKTWIATLEAELAGAPSAEGTPPPLAPEPAPETPAAGAPSQSPPAARGDSGEGRPGASGWRWAGAIAASGGLLLAGTGIYFGLRARNLEEDAERQARQGESEGWTSEIDRQVRGTVSRAETAEKTMIGLFVAGGAAVLTGSVLWIYGSRSEAAAGSVAWRPALAPNAALLVAEGRF